MLAGCRAVGATGELMALGGGELEERLDAVLEMFPEADAFALGSPVYRASFATPLKALLDRLPRGMWGEGSAPVTGRAVAICLTGASWHHSLALDHLRGVLAGFFAAHVISPGLYVPAEEFTGDGLELADELASRAWLQGAALVELSTAIAQGSALARVVPQA